MCKASFYCGAAPSRFFGGVLRRREGMFARVHPIHLSSVTLRSSPFYLPMREGGITCRRTFHTRAAENSYCKSSERSSFPLSHPPACGIIRPTSIPIHSRSYLCRSSSSQVHTSASLCYTRRSFFTSCYLLTERLTCHTNQRDQENNSQDSSCSPQSILVDNAQNPYTKESIASTSKVGFSSSMSSPSSLYPTQFRMVLLRRALEQHVLVQQAIQEAGLAPNSKADEVDASKNSDHIGESFTSSSNSSSFSPSFHQYLRNSAVITRAEFDTICATCHITNTTEALEKLERAAFVVVLDDACKYIHLCPAGYMYEMQVQEAVRSAEQAAGKGSPCREWENGIGNSTPLDANFRLPQHFLESAVQQRIDVLEAEEISMRQELKGAFQRAALHSTRRYTVLAFLLAVQIAVVARLTFYELDWDIMEPVTYCFSVFVSIVFYAYFIRHGEECTCDDVHQRFAPSLVRRFAPKDFDWERYNEVCQALDRERRVKQRIRQWVSEH